MGLVRLLFQLITRDLFSGALTRRSEVILNEVLSDGLTILGINGPFSKIPIRYVGIDLNGLQAGGLGFYIYGFLIRFRKTYAIFFINADLPLTGLQAIRQTIRFVTCIRLYYRLRCHLVRT